MRRPARLLLLTCLAAVVAAPAGAEWRRIDTPNFIVVGDVSARELRSVAVKFEGFRETLSRVLSKGATSAAVPTVVIVFPSDKAFTPFKPTYQGKPREDIHGIFVPRQDVNYIAVESGTEADDRIIFHEYAHLVIGNVMPRVPVWLNEGLAEFYSTFKLMNDGRRAQIGVPIPEHLRLLNSSGRMLLSDLLKVDQHSPYYNEGARATVFYAESWALTHLILNGQPGRANELAAYVRSVNAGVPEDRAWDEAFGPHMDQVFREYLQRPAYNTVLIEFPVSITSFTASPVLLRLSDADAFLASFLVARHELDQAAAQLAMAVQSDPDDPLVQAVMATVDLERRQPANAKQRLLMAGKTDDWFAAYATGIALGELADGNGAGGPDTEAIQAARLRFEAVRQARENVPNVLAHLVSLALDQNGEPSGEMRTLIARARELAPGRPDYAFVQAQLLGRLGDFDGARNVLGPLMTDAYPTEVRNAARRLMAVVVEWQKAQQPLARRAEPASGAAGAAPAVVPAMPATSPPTSATTSVAAPRPYRRRSFTPVYRALNAGENRLEGMLDRLECRPGGSLLFHVAGSDGEVPLAAATFAGVAFISYRDDLTGSVSCGPFKEPMHVFVTWRDGDSGRPERIVVAVEFLPKE